MTISIGSATHAGRVRAHNEDSVLRADRFAAVADGMGGHAAGDHASQLAVRRMAELTAAPTARPDDVINAIIEINAEILAAGAAHSELAGMGTTLAGVGLVLVGGSDHWIVFNVGDSRVYRYADGTLSQVTVDHSEVEELRAAGRLSPEQARHYPRRNVITRSLGTDPPPEPDLWVFPPVPGERFLICSDGLTLELDDADIAAVLRDIDDHQRAADALVERAVSVGGRDNVTVIVVGLEITPAVRAVDGDTAPRNRDVKGR